MTDAEMDLFHRTADIISRTAYRGRPIHIRFTCPICRGSAEIIRRSPLHGRAYCETCGVAIARGNIPMEPLYPNAQTLWDELGR